MTLFTSEHAQAALKHAYTIGKQIFAGEPTILMWEGFSFVASALYSTGNTKQFKINGKPVAKLELIANPRISNMKMKPFAEIRNVVIGTKVYKQLRKMAPVGYDYAKSPILIFENSNGVIITKTLKEFTAHVDSVIGAASLKGDAAKQMKATIGKQCEAMMIGMIDWHTSTRGDTDIKVQAAIFKKNGARTYRSKSRYENYTGPTRGSVDIVALNKLYDGIQTKDLWDINNRKYTVPREFALLAIEGQRPQFTQVSGRDFLALIARMRALRMMGKSSQGEYKVLQADLNKFGPGLWDIICPDGAIGSFIEMMTRACHAYYAIGVKERHRVWCLPQAAPTGNILQNINNSKITGEFPGDHLNPQAVKLGMCGLLFADTAMVSKCFGVDLSWTDIIKPATGFDNRIGKVIGLPVDGGKNNDDSLIGPKFLRTPGQILHGRKADRMDSMAYLAAGATGGADAMKNVMKRIEDSSEMLSFQLMDKDGVKGNILNVRPEFKCVVHRTSMQENERNNNKRKWTEGLKSLNVVKVSQTTAQIFSMAKLPKTDATGVGIVVLGFIRYLNTLKFKEKLVEFRSKSDRDNAKVEEVLQFLKGSKKEQILLSVKKRMGDSFATDSELGYLEFLTRCKEEATFNSDKSVSTFLSEGPGIRRFRGDIEMAAETPIVPIGDQVAGKYWALVRHVEHVFELFDDSLFEGEDYEFMMNKKTSMPSLQDYVDDKFAMRAFCEFLFTDVNDKTYVKLPDIEAARYAQKNSLIRWNQFK